VKEDETEIGGGTGIYKSIEEFNTTAANMVKRPVGLNP
jgi:hypothetical protein